MKQEKLERTMHCNLKVLKMDCSTTNGVNFKLKEI
jgi:hypothetical protein